MVALRSVVLLALVASLLLAGCSSSPGSANLAGIPDGDAPSGVNSGSASSHDQATRAESGVTIDRDGGQYVARKTITITNDFGGADSAQVTLRTGGGGVNSRAWSEGGYKTVAILQGRASSEAAARDALDDITLTHSDRLGSGRLTLTTEAKMPSSHNGVSYTASITANLPSEPAYDLVLRAGSGGADSSGLVGRSIDVSTGSGGVSVHGSFGSIVANSGSGGVEVSGVGNDVTATTGSGGVDVDLKPGGSGRWTFRSGSGGVDVTLGRTSGAAYDAEATAGSGGASVSLSGGEDVGAQTKTHQHMRSAGYDAADIQVQVSAETGSGGASISG